MKLLITLFLVIISSLSFSSSILEFDNNDTISYSYSTYSEYSNELTTNVELDTNINKTKLIAVCLAITLGVFGVHRLYLGTKSIVPIAYTLTLGGGFFILPAIDIFYIIAAKDINQIKNNDFVFMWNKKKKL